MTPITATTQYLPRPNGEIAFEVSGAGPLVVAIPGMGDARGSYRFLTPQLVDAGYRVASFDLRGHGESSSGFTEFDDMAAASDAIALIEELGGGSTRQHEVGPITSGLLLGIEEGWFTGQIADSAFGYQTQLEKGDKKIVGVNIHAGTVTPPLEILRVSHEVEVEQNASLVARRSARDHAAVEAALGDMIKVARADGNMIEPMLTAARAEATLGEICNALRAEWGEYVEPARF